MKKFLASLLALAMAVSMSVTAFAATELETSPADGKSEGSYSIAVTGKYVAGSNAKETISVDIAWEKMEFTYTAGSSSYSPDTHKTTTTAGSWNADKKAITVTNHSNVYITAGFTFTQGNGVTTTGSFYDSAEATTALAADKQNFTLASAEDKTTEGQNYTVPSSKIYFGVSGDAISEDTTLGTITVKIEKESYAGLLLAESLDAIKTTGGTITLSEDMTLTRLLTLSGGTEASPVILDLGGKTITGHISVEKGSYVTLRNGTINYTKPTRYPNITDVTAVYVEESNCTLEDITVNATDVTALNVAGGVVTAENCTFNGGSAVAGGTITVVSQSSFDSTTGNFTDSTLTFKNSVTLEHLIRPNGGYVILAAGGTYTINGVVKTPTADHTVSASEDGDIILGS